jgi:alkylation response protein AidB-like acyl-CoA dehydrogenase
MAAYARTPETIDWTALAETLGAGFAARAAALDAADAFAAEDFAELVRHRLPSAGVPAELGGGGADAVALAALLRTLARYSGSTALAFAMHTHLVATAAWRWRHDNAPTDSLLRRIAREQILLVGSGGADWLESSGKAIAVPGGFRITARKPFASGTPAGAVLMTSAVLEEAGGVATVLHFPVPLSADGVRIEETWRAHGMRATGSHDIVLDNVFVAEEAIGGRRPKGPWHKLFHLMVLIAMPLIYSVYLGIAEAARAIAVREAGRRKDDPGVQMAVGALETDLMTARMAVERMVALAGEALPVPETTGEVLTCRVLAGKACIRTVEAAMEVVGGRGFYRDFGLERLWRDVQGARYHPLPEPAQRALAGRLALGVSIDG